MTGGTDGEPPREGKGMKRSLLAVAVLVALALAACGTETSEDSGSGAGDRSSDRGDEPVKVALIYTGSVTAAGWDAEWDAAREELASRFADDAEFVFKEKVPEGAQTTQVVNGLIREGADLVIGTSFGFGEPLIEAAKENPDVYFLQSQWESPGLENFSGFDAGPEDGYYVAGVAAGYLAKSGKLGWVDAFPIPYDLRGLNAFQLGVQKANPSATTQGVLTNSWFDPGKESQATQTLARDGAEVIGTSLGSQAIGQASERATVPFVIGSTDGSRYGESQALTSVRYDWTPLLEPAIEAVIDGTWKSEFTYVGMPEGVVQLADWGPPYEELTAKQKETVDSAHEAIESGEQEVFTGPIEDTSGEVVVPSGESMSVGELEGMAFVVKGVNGIQVE